LVKILGYAKKLGEADARGGIKRRKGQYSMIHFAARAAILSIKRP
jgi:hypothetical protein